MHKLMIKDALPAMNAYGKAYPATSWGAEGIATYNGRINRLLTSSIWSANPDMLEPQIGDGNVKTDMINEGTSSGAAGTCDPSCVGDCDAICYVMTHVDGVRPVVRERHAINTLFRRRDPLNYYRAFFRAAVERGVYSVRVNETGDFEHVADLTALECAAMEFPNVNVIGYTKRANLLHVVAELNKLPNVRLHFSLACKCIGESVARMHGVPVTRVTTDPAACSCPNQVKRLKAFTAAYEAAVKAGKGEKAAIQAGKDAVKASPSWSCKECARRGCGCFSRRDVNFLVH